MGKFRNRYAPSACAVAIVLTNCGGLQQPLAAPAIPSAATGAYRVAPASSYKQLFRFHPKQSGTNPWAGLLNVNGTLYGTTLKGGKSGYGTVYSISTNGTRTVLYSFAGGSDAQYPQSNLIDVKGTLYGTTPYGGAFGAGAVYSITPSGSEKVVYSFQGESDGADPLTALLDVNGTLYGTTAIGGSERCESGAGCGVVFSVTASGRETVLYRFAGGSDGSYPYGALIDVNGALYGTTANGGTGSGYPGGGTVYRVTTAGAEKVLYSFQGGTDGQNPASGLLDVKGKLYGTTGAGGQSASNCLASSCGTVYRVTTKGAETVLYRFAGGSDGATPASGLIDVKGTLYGTTLNGGASCTCGTVYSVSTSGAETVLYRFTGGTDGWIPIAGLTDVHGTLYGTTELGGDKVGCCSKYGGGTVFTFSP